MKPGRFEVWRARVRFEDSAEVEERPVLVWNRMVFIIAYKMTGTDRGDGDDEYRIRYWREAGLDKPTSIRIEKVLRLRETDLVYKCGALDVRDQLIFENRLAGLFGK